MKKLMAASFLTLCFVSNVEASFSDVREYTNHTINATDANGIVAATSFVYPSAPHGMTVTARRTYVDWAAGVTADEPAPATVNDAYTITLTIKESSTTKITCNIIFSRDNSLAGKIEFFNNAYCGGTALVPGTTYTWEVSVVMTTGTNKISDAVYSLQFIQTDTVTDETSDVVNSQSIVNRVNINSNTNSTVLSSRTNINSNTNSTSDELSNGTWARWDYSNNRNHLEVFQNPITIRGEKNKQAYGYLFPGGDSDSANDDPSFFIPRREEFLIHNMSLTTNFRPDNPGGGGSTFGEILLLSDVSTGAWWRIGTYDGSRALVGCQATEFVIFYYHSPMPALPGIEGSVCLTYGIPHYLSLIRDDYNQTITWNIDGTTEGPFSYASTPLSGVPTTASLIIGGPQTISGGIPFDCSNPCYKGTLTEFRLWNDVIPLTNLTKIANPSDEYLKFCAEGTELALYYFEPYLVQPLQNCLSLSTNNFVTNIGEMVNQTFNSTVYLNQTLSGNITQNYFNITDGGNLTHILAQETATIANSIDAFFWLALIALTIIVPKYMPNKALAMGLSALLACFAIFIGFSTFPESGFKSISFFIGFLAFIFSIVLVNSENKKRKMRDEY